MIATIYRLFRSIISDESVEYTVTDFEALIFLDRALDKLSDVSDYTFNETITLTQADVDQGFFELAREILTLQEHSMSESGYNWELGGGKKIRIIKPEAFSVDSELEFTYRSRYNKFDDEVKNESDMDYPTEAVLGIVFYALGDYIQAKGISDADDDVVGAIKEKAEENLKVEYAVDGDGFNSISNPLVLKKMGTSMMRDLATSQDTIFSVKMR